MTKPVELYDKLDEILDFIGDFIYKNNYPPSVREIQQNFSIASTSSVHYYLKKLQMRGDIRVNESKSRTIEVVADKPTYTRDLKSIPCIGDITAGVPILAEENLKDVYNFSKDLFTSSGELFMLDVHGSSMINAGIFNGDKIIVRQQATAENGQIIAALLDDCATVKRYYNRNGQVFLKAENPNIPEIKVDMNYFSVLGLVVGLIRTNIN